MYACIPSVCLVSIEVRRGYQGVMDLQEVVLQTAVNHHVGVGNCTRVLCKSNKFS